MSFFCGCVMPSDVGAAFSQSGARPKMDRKVAGRITETVQGFYQDRCLGTTLRSPFQKGRSTVENTVFHGQKNNYDVEEIGT
jgi:hypothetical protein